MLASLCHHKRATSLYLLTHGVLAQLIDAIPNHLDYITTPLNLEVGRFAGEMMLKDRTSSFLND